MAKMENMSVVEEEMLAFLRRSFQLSAQNIKPALEKLSEKLKQHENNRLETRAFVYLDVISWLESKISGVPVRGNCTAEICWFKKIIPDSFYYI
jgi:ribulose kinase